MKYNNSIVALVLLMATPLAFGISSRGYQQLVSDKDSFVKAARAFENLDSNPANVKKPSQIVPKLKPLLDQYDALMTKNKYAPNSAEGVALAVAIDRVQDSVHKWATLSHFEDEVESDNIFKRLFGIKTTRKSSSYNEFVVMGVDELIKQMKDESAKFNIALDNDGNIKPTYYCPDLAPLLKLLQDHIETTTRTAGGDEAKLKALGESNHNKLVEAVKVVLDTNNKIMSAILNAPWAGNTLGGPWGKRIASINGGTFSSWMSNLKTEKAYGEKDAGGGLYLVAPARAKRINDEGKKLVELTTEIARNMTDSKWVSELIVDSDKVPKPLKTSYNDFKSNLQKTGLEIFKYADVWTAYFAKLIAMDTKVTANGKELEEKIFTEFMDAEDPDHSGIYNYFRAFSPVEAVAAIFYKDAKDAEERNFEDLNEMIKDKLKSMFRVAPDVGGFDG